MCGDLYAVNLTQSSASRRIAKFLLSGTMVNCRAMCESLFIQSTCILSTLFLSVFGKFAEFCFVYSVENLVKALNNFMGSFISCALSSNRSDFLDLDNLVDFTCILVQWHRQHKRDVSLAIKDSVQSNDFVCFNRSTMQSKFRTTVQWKRVSCAVFVRRIEAPVSACRYVSRQNQYTCPHHHIYVCVDFLGSGYICVAEKCSRKSKWRCPFAMCNYSLCDIHLFESDE